MAKENEARINLCFNLNDPHQKIVYAFLKGIEREKTSVVADIILRQIIKENQATLDTISRKLDELYEKIERTDRRVSDIGDKLESGASFLAEKKGVTDSDTIPRQAAAPDDSDEISDEAFADMISLMY